MPRISDIAIIEVPQQTTAVIKTTTRVQDLPQLIGQSYSAIAAYLKQHDVWMTDIPFVAYHNMDMQNLQVEIGFPVANALPAHETIQVGSTPAGKVAFCMYLGPYQQVEPVYREMMQWIEDNGYAIAGPGYEYYYNGPGFPEEQFLTKIVFPVQKK